jgi:hypothetical protein
VATAVSLGLVGVCFFAIMVALLGRVPVGFALAALTGLSVVVLAPLFLTWFFLVRRNAGLWGRQRRSQGWAIGGWFVPVIFLWFPFQIADDAWRASQPVDQPARSRAVVIGWWTCWLLAWITGFDFQSFETTNGDLRTRNIHIGFELGSTLASAAFTAAAALLGALMVHRLGRMQQARMAMPASYYPQ